MNSKLRYDQDIRRVVLVVEDEPINQEMLGFILERDYEVRKAFDGRQALEIMQKIKKTLSLVLLDLNMPVMNGFELLEALRKDVELKHIPVIVLTAEDEAEVASLELGAVDFIRKPYNMPAVILARVRRAIELSEDSRIIQDAERDNLTGLYSRVFFFEYAAQMDQFYPDRENDCIAINIEHFHLVNELHGRNYGDQVLIGVADAIREAIGPRGGMICRCEGDMFFVYRPHREEYEELLQRINRAVSREFSENRIRLRMGVYTGSSQDNTIERRFDCAKMACDTIRGNYLKTVAIYDNRLHEREIMTERLEHDMQRGLDEKQFKVWYQPKYAIQGSRPVLSSAEALIRWEHPELGRISPAVFVPLFETNGMIQKLDYYVWQEAGIQVKKWRETTGCTVPVSVNVSRIDIYDPMLAEKFQTILRENELAVADYMLEITESAYSEEADQLIQKVEQLRDMGFRVEMDDFGSGYSTLNMLTQLPIDVLKLDMKFIQNLTVDVRNYRLVELVLDIARFLGVPIIAEGVETEEQYQVVQGLGFDLVQGYYFSRPLPPDAFEDLIRRDLVTERSSTC